MSRVWLSALSLVLISGHASAAPGNLSFRQGRATARVVSPLVITHDSGSALRFGKFTTGNGGTIVIAANGSATMTGEIRALSGSTTSADGFSVTGQRARAFSITSTSGSVVWNSTSMAFTTKPSRTTATIRADGTAVFTVGGKLTVPAAMPPGTYTGSYAVTVTYN